MDNNPDETAGEEITDTASGWQPNPDWDAASEVTEPVKTSIDIHAEATADAAMKLNDILTPPTAPKPTTIAEPELMGSSDEPTDAEIAAAEAILARRKPSTTPVTAPPDPDAPVSDKPIPIRLLETVEPAREAQTRVMIGDMEIIGTAEKIEYVKKLYGVTQDPEQAVVSAAQPVNPMISASITAEQEAGRRALARRQAQAVSHPPLAKTEDELALEKPPVTIFRGAGADIQQHLLRQPAVSNKGPGY